MAHFYRRFFSVLLFVACLHTGSLFGQCTTCGAFTQTVNLSSKADTAWTQSGPTRSGTCCAGSDCIKFVVYLNAGSDLLSFNVTNPAPSGSAFYQINCGGAVSIGQPACISGSGGTICITYCKPGGDSPNYHITASKTVRASSDATLRVGCAATMTVGGLSASTVSWTSVSPGTAGLYNSYLTCSTGCSSTTINPTAATPTLIAYRVAGSPISGCPGTNADTVLVTVVPGMTAAISPTAPVVCSGGSSTIALTATATGGQAPYTFTWNTSANSSSIGAGAGNFTVLISDILTGCTPVSKTITVAAVTTPTAPAVTSSTPVCAGQTLSLSASNAGTGFLWSGPNSFTSALQNPTLLASAPAAGNYSVSATFSGCTGPAGTIAISVNAVPGTPTITSNSPVCATQDILFSSNTVSGATYIWTGPNGFTSSLQNPTVTGAGTVSAGNYSLVISNNGCQSPMAVTSVTVNTTPAQPTAGSNAPICAGQNLSLTALPGGTSFQWNGPGGFSSTQQNPVLSSVSATTAGVYSLVALNGSCQSTQGTVSVTVNPIPPTPTLSTNAPLCSGQTISFTALPNGMSYMWNGPGTFTSSLQNPTIANASTLNAGVYSMVVTAAGCSGPAGTVAVTVINTPSAPSASNSGPVCQNASLQFSVSPGGLTYSWTGPNSFSSTQQNPSISSVSLLSAGVYSVTASSSGCTSAPGTTSVTVNPIPAAPSASGTSILCEGGTITLSATSSGATSYSWTGPNNFSSPLQNTSISNAGTLATGSYSVTRVVNGCTSPPGTFSVTVNPIPPTPTAIVTGGPCTGLTYSFSASPNGMLYSWTGPSGFSSSSQNFTRAITSSSIAGTYSLTVTSLGCTSPAGTVAVVVVNTPSAPSVSGSSTLCAGSNISLTATGTGGTYNWSGPNGFSSSGSSMVVSGAGTVATGIYSVTETLSGCTGSAGTRSVTVFGIPTSPAVSSNAPLCTGQTLSLTAAFVNGATYAWSGPNAFASALQNPVISNIGISGAGNYSVSISVAGCGGAATVVAVTVNQTPNSPGAGSNSPLCAGDNIALTATASSGTYSWTGPNGFTSTNQNPSISNASVSSSGVYSVTNTQNGCTSAPGTTSVTVNPIPTAPSASGTSTLCAGGTITLSATSSGATSYSWTGPNNFSSSLQNTSISNAGTLATGIYSVTRVVNGCTSPPGTFSVTVNPIPVTPTAAVMGAPCTGLTYSFFAAPDGMSYNWSGPSGFSSASQNFTLAITSSSIAGTYSLTVTSLGCTSSAAIVIVTVVNTPSAPSVSGPSTLCAGSNITLTATGTGGTYNWSGPSGFSSTGSSMQINGATTAATGIYSVTETVSGCTGNPGTRSVTVLGVPAAPPISSNGPVCTGQTLSLSAAFVAGATYSWNGPNAFTSTVQNPTISNVGLSAGGNYSVSISVGGCGGASTVIGVTVNQTPNAPGASNNSPLCAGGNLNLSATGSAGSFLWTGPNSFTASNQNPTISGASVSAAGTYSVTNTQNGCTSAAALTNVTVNPIPAAPLAGGLTTVCIGQTLSLTATGSGTIYSWSGPNGFSSSAQNTVIPNATSSAAGTYSVTQTILGCVSPAGTINIAVNPIPSQPTVGSNAPICALKTLSLFAGPGGASYNWTGPGGFSSASQNPVIVSASLSSAGSYSVTQTVLGCTSSATVISITINPAAPTPTATSNSPVCVNGTVSFTQTSISSATYSWSGPNGFSSSSQNPVLSNAQASASGSYSVFATVAGCPGNTFVLSVLVSNMGTVNAGPTSSVCANNAMIALTGTSSTGSGTWSSSGGGSFQNNSLNGTYNPSSADINNGTVTFTLTSTNNGGCVPVSTTKTVVVTPAPTANAGASQTLCANNATFSLSGSVTIATGGMWTSSGNGTFLPNNTSLSGSYVPGSSDFSANGATITLVTTGNGNCNAVTNSKIVHLSPSPVVSPGGNPLVVCKNNPNFQINGSSTTGGLSWASSGTGSFSPSANLLNPTYVPSTADTTAGQITLTLTSTNNGLCNAVSQTVSLIYTGTINITAGANQTVCSNVPIVLNGVSTTSAGAWTSNGTGLFSPTASSLNTSYMASQADVSAGGVNFTVTSTNNGGCNPVTSTMSVSLIPGPQANAGGNQTICANNATVSLTGSVAVASGGQWFSSGSGSFSPNASAMNVVYQAAPADTTSGSITLSLTTTGNGSCSATTSTVKVSFLPAPLVKSGFKMYVCRNNPVVTLNGYVSTGTGTWTTLGTGLLSNPSALNSSYTPGTADTTAGSVKLILTSTNNGNCNAVDDTLTIYYSAPPTLTSVPSMNICANNASVALTGTSSTGSGTWAASGPGTFSPNAISGIYFASAAEILSGITILTLQTTNNGGCSPITGETTVFITPAPLVDAGTDKAICINAASVALSGSFSISSGAGWWTAGNGSFVPDTSSMNPGYHPGTADTTAGSVKLFLTSTGNGNCLAVTDSALVSFVRPATVNAGSDIALCPYLLMPPLSGSSTSGTYLWNTLGTGNFLPSNAVANPTYIPGASDSSIVVKLVLTSVNAACGDARDTLLLSFHKKPTAAFVSADRCTGALTHFTATTASTIEPVNSWFWQFGPDTSTKQKPDHQFSASGNHTVTLRVSNGYCSDSVTKVIHISQPPPVAFSHSVLCRDSVRFARTSQGTGLTSWTWDFGDGSSSVLLHPYHVYGDTGLFVASLRVRSDSGCTAEAIDTIHVTRCPGDLVSSIIAEPAIPSGFTPNGDGNNDVLRVKGGPFTKIDFRIFNEWGNQIYQSTQQSEGWDGTYRSAMQPSGRFIWTLDAELPNGTHVKKAGEVILNR
jgi:gliding motility-associated-like protein